MENLKVGDTVTHPNKPEWGIGEILKLRSGKIEVHFSEEGIKTFQVKHINLTPVTEGTQTSFSSVEKRKFDLQSSPYKDPTRVFTEEFWHVYPPAFRGMFQEGSLIQEWKDKFPLLFDDNDEEAVFSHRGQKLHFFREWLGAILIHQKYGHSCLCGNYTHNAHRSKQAIMGALFDAPIHQKIQTLIKDQGRQALPSLIFYTPDLSHKYFVHVRDAWQEKFDYHTNKTPTPLDPKQLENFRWIREELKLEIKVINLQKEIDPTRIIM